MGRKSGARRSRKRRHRSRRSAGAIDAQISSTAADGGAGSRVSPVVLHNSNSSSDNDSNSDSDSNSSAQDDEPRDALKPSDQWSCPACTFLNGASRAFCEMCETPNPVAATSSSRMPTLGGTTSEGPWSCVACTMKNPQALRSCAVCGTSNPHSSALSLIQRLHGHNNMSSDDDDDDLSDDDDDDDNDDMDGEDSNEEDSSHAVSSKKKKALKKAKRQQERAKKKKKQQKKAKQEEKNEYGVSSKTLKRLAETPTSQNLVDTLQTLTHTLAMMDASTGSGWGSMRGASLFIRSFDGSSLKKTKDSTLLAVLTGIFCEHEHQYALHVRLLAVQSINYLVKLDRHLYSRSVMLKIVSLYLDHLLQWHKRCVADTNWKCAAKDEQMIVEECLTGLAHVCDLEGFAVRELIAQRRFDGYLDFLSFFISHDSGFHPNIITTAVELLLKCCMKMRWNTSSTVTRVEDDTGLFQGISADSSIPNKMDGIMTVSLAKKQVDLLRTMLNHKHVPLHVKAAKCLLLLFHRIPAKSADVITELVSADVLGEFIELVANGGGDESEESRLSMLTLLIQLFDNRPRLVALFVETRLYNEFFGGILPVLQSSSSSLGTHALKLTALLTRVVCRKHVRSATNGTERDVIVPTEGSLIAAGMQHRARFRSDSAPDPDVLSTLLLEFVRAGSVAAVSAILKDGADINGSRTLEADDEDVETPLQVAAMDASLAMVRFLVKRGADVRRVGPKGTALHIAALHGRCDIVSFLLQCGASVNAKDRAGKSVLECLESSEDNDEVKSHPSPVKEMLELHRKASRQDYDSDMSDGEDYPSVKARTYMFSEDPEGEFNDEDEELDDDDQDEEDAYYMDYDEDEDEDDYDDEEDDEHLAKHLEDSQLNTQSENAIKDDQADVNDNDIINHDYPDRKNKGKKRHWKMMSSYTRPGQSDLPSGTTRKQSSDALATAPVVETHLSGKDVFKASSDEIVDFSLAVSHCLLGVLRDMDIQNVDRTVISTLASVLEMAPSSLIRGLNESDVVLILDTVHFLLQNQHSILDLDTNPVNTATSGGGDNVNQHKMNLSPFILSVRILQAVIRKSSPESSIYYQIERRGICEQIEQLNDSSASWARSSADPQDCVTPDRPRNTIFSIGLFLIEVLRANMLESGTLHLHKLKNLARRMSELSDKSLPSERELALVDLVELLEQPNSITAYEFKQSDLLPALLQYVSPNNVLDEERMRGLLQAFNRCPAALKHLVSRLQSIITQEEKFPVVSFNSTKGRELYPLTRQLKISISRFDRDNITKIERSSGVKSAEDILFSKTIQSSPLTHFQSFERTIFRCLPVDDSKLSTLYLNIVGRCIQKAVDGKWKKFWVCGYDSTRSFHLLKPVGGSEADMVEMVIHDSQYRLLEPVDVHQDLKVNLELFGTPVNNSVSNCSNRKRKSNKKKRKLSHEKSNDSMNHLCAVEVQNDGSFESGLRKAWYAGIIVDQESDEKKLRKFESLVKPYGVYSVQLLHSKKVIKNISADRLRKRSNSPQIGSVVEVDGVIGQVTKVYSKLEAIGIAGGLLDVKITDSIEKLRVKLNRVQYPPSISTKETETGQIEAMSIRRLFPARESSVAVGSVGDRVWVFPVSSSLSGICVAGIIKSFPSGLESIRESTTVNVEVSFGSDQPSLMVKVEQSRVLNFGCLGSGSGSSRFLAALKAATGHENFGTNGIALQQALQGVAGSMRSEFGLGRFSVGSSGMDQLRHLISRVSRDSTDETIESTVRNSSMTETTPLETTASPDSERLTTVDADADIASVDYGTPSSSQATARKKGPQAKEKEAVRNDQIWQHLSTEETTPSWICDVAPKVNLLLGFYKREATGDRMSSKYAFLEESSDVDSRRSTNNPALVLLVRHQTTNQYELNIRSKHIFREIFKSFGPLLSKPPPKKKRKTNSMTITGRLGCAENTEWDLNIFCAFFKCIFQESKGSSIAKEVEQLILFSKYASEESQRRLLLPDGFLALMTNICKDNTKARHVLMYLKSLGHSEKSLSADISADTDVSLFSKSSADKVTLSEAHEEENAMKLRGFPADRNVLSCVEELRDETNATANLHRGERNELLPPWKFTYKIFCDFEVQWIDLSGPSLSAKGRSKKALKNGSTQLPIRQVSLFTSKNDSIEVFESRDQKLTLSFSNAVQLLRYLNSNNLNSIADIDIWTNPRLYNKMETQLQDVLSMCSGIYPKWCDNIVTRCKFFFPRELREKLFRATSFGCTRSLHWFRNQLMNEEAQSNGDSASSGIDVGGILNQEISIAPIPKERVKVHRDNILSSAEAVMQMHAKRKAILDVVFVGEKGYGSGVTAAFYSAAAYALQSCEENKKPNLCCWVPGEEDSDEVIRHPNGLFPFPHTSPHKTLVDRFRMMGRLAGKALMDERLLPLPLSSQFMKLIVGEPVPEDQIGNIFLSHGKIIHSMNVASRKLARGEPNVTINGMALEGWLDAVSFTFIDPMSQQPLHPGGELVAVDVTNMAMYVKAVLKLWLDEGVSAQVIAFREGISEVLPLEKLKLLFVSEILSMLCGDADIKWDTASLLKSMKLAHGYTKDSLPVQYLIETLDGMTIDERRGFLLYATGCPNLPPGGFAALKPPFEVVRRVVDVENVDRALPFARTCTNTLHLPAYSSKEVCAEKLVFAIANSQGVIDRD